MHSENTERGEFVVESHELHEQQMELSSVFKIQMKIIIAVAIERH